VATPGLLTVATQPHHREGPRPVRLVVEAPGTDTGAWQERALRLPGMEVAVRGPGAGEATTRVRPDGRFEVVLPPPPGPSTYEVAVTSTGSFTDR
jgi:hypothetical protein